MFEGASKSRLTRLCTYVLEQARREVEQFIQSVHSIQSCARNEIGRVHVACAPSFATHVLPPALSHFLSRWPRIEVDIRDMDSTAVRREVEQGRVDFGVASFPSAQPGPDISPLMADRFGVVCPAGHPLIALGRPLRWTDLAGHALIANGICRMIKDPDFQDILDRSSLMVRNTSSILAPVSAGVGITLLPRLAVSVGTDKARFLPLAYRDILRPLQIIRRANSAPTPAAEAFVDILRQTVGAMGREMGDQGAARHTNGSSE